MALNRAAVIGKFEMYRSFVHKSLMHQTSLAETFEDAINCNLVWNNRCKVYSDLVLCQGFVGLEQDA